MPGAVRAILNSGGQMAPTTDKLRRGFKPGGMSPESDMNTGGAAYFFTRIQRRDTAHARPGIVWRAGLLGRLDAISYDHDAYGRVANNYAAKRRKTGVEEWRETARSGSNETIFKNSLSIFDAVDRIVASSSSEREEVLRVLREARITAWPDGRPIEDVVTVAR